MKFINLLDSKLLIMKSIEITSPYLAMTQLLLSFVFVLFSLWWLPKSHWPQVIWMRLFELQHYLCCFDQLQWRFFLVSKLKHDTGEVIIKMEDFLWKPRYHSFLTWHLRFNHIFFGLCWVLVVLGVQCFDATERNSSGGAQRWLLFLCQHIYIQVGKHTNLPISFQFLLHKSHHLAFCEKTLKFSAGFCLQPPRFIVFYLRGCGHCRRTWGENPGHLGEGEPPK